MDFNQIQYFLAIAETENFSKAAERLFMSQPSLSNAIKKLEQELGVTLFERGGRRVLLTPDGRFFKKKAEILLQEYQSILNGLRNNTHYPTLKIGTVHTILGSTLARLIDSFRQQNPDIIIELHTGHLEELQRCLETGEIDLSITTLDNYDTPKSSVALIEQPFLLAVPSSHPFALESSINISELNGQPYIDRIHCEIWRARPNWFESMGIEPRIVYFADHEEWVISMIQVGLGVSIMPVWKEVNDIVYVNVSDMTLSRIVGLKWRNGHSSDLVKQFRSVALKHDW